MNRVPRVRFKIESVYNSEQKSSSFDFAIQNGVFHHLQNEDKAYREVWRVLRPGGYFWIYTDGKDSIAGDIQDTAARILSRFRPDEVGAVLNIMGLSIGKRYHLGDSLQATYRHTDLKTFQKRLQKYGFSVVKRLMGGFSYDSDGEAQLDPWAKEKFGSGDIRYLVVKSNK